MKRLHPILLLLLAMNAFSQDSLDSVSLAEMEDSISTMSIIPIKKPKALLDSIIVQVIRDSRQKPVRCKYQTMYTTGLHTAGPNTSRCFLHAIANIKIKATGEGEKFHYEGPRRLINLHDTVSVYSALKAVIEGDYM